MRRLKEKGVGIIFVTHSWNRFMQYVTELPFFEMVSWLASMRSQIFRE